MSDILANSSEEKDVEVVYLCEYDGELPELRKEEREWIFDIDLYVDLL